jgi:hypothetical protein
MKDLVKMLLTSSLTISILTLALHSFFGAVDIWKGMAYAAIVIFNAGFLGIILVLEERNEIERRNRA